MEGYIEEIGVSMAVAFVLPRHYSGRKPQVSIAFGWFSKKPLTQENLVAVCIFGKPASNQLCKGICGEKYSESVYELNRLCRLDSWKQPLSMFVSRCLKELRKRNWIVVSYSDMAMNHHGYIYQACNFLYTGCTKERTDKYTLDGKHSRHYKESEQTGLRKVRSPKHRYVYFCTSNKHLLREWKENLRYPVLPYPKGNNNENYVLGEFLLDKTVEDTTVHEEVPSDKINLF